MGKKRKCMAQGGSVYPQERPVKPVQEPEWKQSLSRAWEAIKGNVQPNPNPPPTANTLAGTASAIVNRKVDNLDAMKRSGYANGGAIMDENNPFFAGIQNASPTSATPDSVAAPQWKPMETGQSLGYIGGYDYRGVDPARVQAQQQAQQQPGMTQQIARPDLSSMTFAEKDRALGLDPNRVYRPGAADDPHGGNTAYSNIRRNALPPEVPPSNPVPSFEAPQFESRRARRRGYADGGKIDPVEELLRRTSQNYGTQPSKPQIPVQQPQQPIQKPIQKPIQQQQPQEQAIGLVETIKRRQAELDKAANYADGGMTMFKGKGGPRDDQIPVTVAGDEINVSNGEAGLILPAKTAKSPQALSQIAQTIAQSNDGRAPKMGIEAGGKYQGGAVDRYPYDGKEPPTAQDLYAPVSSKGMANAVQENGLVQNLRSSGLLPAGNVPHEVARNSSYQGVADVAYGVTDDVKRDFAAGNTAAGVMRGLRGAAALPVAAASDLYGIAKKALSPAGDALRVLATGESPTDSVQPNQAQATNPAGNQAVQPQEAPTSPAVKQALAQSTNNAGNAAVNPKTGNLEFTQPWFDPTKVQFAQGTGAATRNSDGKTIVVGPSNYTAADGTQTSDWYKTQAYADAIKRNEDDKARLAMMVAERQGRDPVQSLATRQGMALTAQEAPMKQQLAQQQVAQGGMALQQAQELQALYELHKASTNPAEQARIADAIRVRTGKSDNRPIAVDMGETISPDGMIKSKNPNVLYDPNTRQVIQLSGGQQLAPKAAIDALKANKTPQMIEAFNAKYGNGSAQQILGK